MSIFLDFSIPRTVFHSFFSFSCFFVWKVERGKNTSFSNNKIFKIMTFAISTQHKLEQYKKELKMSYILFQFILCTY